MAEALLPGWTSKSGRKSERTVGRWVLWVEKDRSKETWGWTVHIGKLVVSDLSKNSWEGVGTQPEAQRQAEASLLGLCREALAVLGS